MKFGKLLRRIWKIKSLALPSYSNRKDLDEPEALRDRLSSQEWCCNCKNCEKILTSLECVVLPRKSEIKAFHLKGKTKLSWNTVALEFLA